MKYPSYLNLSKKELNSRIEKLFKIPNQSEGPDKVSEKCEICPRKCGVNRIKNQKGFCQLGFLPKVSAYHPHFGEEKPLVGFFGSGTIFFTSCNLTCIYCQNYEISQLRIGEEVSFEKLAEIMIELQAKGCHNINLVTPTPQIAQILKALPVAIDRGLKLPLVYNTNAYDSVETLKLLDGIIDIYMPDAKYSNNKIALKYSKAPNYFELMKKAIKEMHRQVGDLKLKIDQKGIEGLAYRGLLIRHLVLPNGLAGTEKIMEFIANEISKDTFLNLMSQYFPYFQAKKFPELNRPITEEEYREAIALARKAGLRRLCSDT